MSAGKYDFTIEQGATFSLPLAYKDSAEALVDLLSYSAVMKIKASPGGTVYASSVSGEGQLITIDLVTNVIELSSTSGATVTDFVASGSTEYATITISDYSSIASGTTIKLSSSNGVRKTFTSGVGSSGTNHNTWMINESNNTTADNFFTMLNEDGNEAWTVANPAANVVTITSNLLRQSGTNDSYTNNVNVSMTATATAALDFETAMYDLELTTGSTTTRLLEGIVTLSQEISS